MNELIKPKKMAVIDPNELDQRIPKNLMILMDNKPFVLKAGLEWKANNLFGLGKWSLKTEIVEYDRKENYALVKATVIFGDQIYENFGEASKENVANPRMHKYMLHMAVTRAEARALRVATACGFTAVEELEEAKIAVPEEKKAEATDLICSNDGSVITESVYDYSVKFFGRPLCFDCQKKEKDKEFVEGRV